MDIDNLLKNESEKFQKGIINKQKKIKEWDEFLSRVKPYFDLICKKSKDHNLFEKLYVIDSKVIPKFSSGLPSITLSWGTHPTDYTKIEDPQRVGIEEGCALHFSQGIFGDVSCTIYPYRSDFHKYSEEYYIYKIYRYPSDITEKELYKAIEMMFVCANISSFLGNPSMKDYLLFGRLTVCSTIKKLKYFDRFKSVFSLFKGIIEAYFSIKT